MLLGAVRPDQPDVKAPSPFLQPLLVGLETALTPEQSGTLYLRINDSASELDDNRGELKVEMATE